jgi:hypothetical protein
VPYDLVGQTLFSLTWNVFFLIVFSSHILGTNKTLKVKSNSSNYSSHFPPSMTRIPSVWLFDVNPLLTCYISFLFNALTLPRTDLTDLIILGSSTTQSGATMFYKFQVCSYLFQQIQILSWLNHQRKLSQRLLTASRCVGFCLQMCGGFVFRCVWGFYFIVIDVISPFAQLLTNLSKNLVML